MSPSKQRALQALITSNTNEAAAKAAGVSLRTIQTYLTDPEFRAALQAGYDDIMQDVTQRAAKMTLIALDALNDVITDPASAAAVKVSAARSVLEYSIKYNELYSIVKRIERLEEGVKDDGNMFQA